MTSAIGTEHGDGKTLPLLPFERVCLQAIALITIAVAVLAVIRSVSIDIASFLPMIGVGGALAATALSYRRMNRAPNISLALMACAILILFTNAGAILNYLLIPLGKQSFDPLLMQLDAMLGFDWQSLVVRLDGYPALSGLLGIVYRSSLLQLVVAILLLGFAGQRLDLHRFILCGMVASLVSIGVWALMPSVGPAAWIEIEPTNALAPARVVGPEYAAELRNLLANGASHIDAAALIGIIAFPSMHTVMMGMSVWYMRKTRFLPVFAAINLPMIPAILTHGGHHLVDVFGGLALFAFAAWLAGRALPFPVQPQTASGGRLIRIASILPPVLRPNNVPRS